MRRGFEGLSYLVKEYLSKDPFSGHLFFFMSRNRSSLKLLYWDTSGWALWYKRLERGTFSLPEKGELSAAELSCVLEGIEIGKMRKKKRFSL
jgi:transposase